MNPTKASNPSRLSGDSHKIIHPVIPSNARNLLSPALAFSYFDITAHNGYAAPGEFAMVLSSSGTHTRMLFQVPERRNA
jgi:hypothetical protein